MNAPLRRLHFAAWCLLSVILAVVFVAGIAARRDTTPANLLHWEAYK